MVSRRRDTNVAPNPVVVAVRDRVKDLRDGFLDNVGQLVEEYESNLKRMEGVAAAEEARKVAARNAIDSSTVVHTTMTATKGLATAIAESLGAKLAPQDTPDAVEGLDEAEEALAPHYIIELTTDTNAQLVCELQLLRKAAMGLASRLDSITDWLALSMPNLNEENSVVAEILGAVLEQVATFVETVRAIVGFPKKYHGARAEIEKALLKLPESKALQMQLELHDAETWDEMAKSWKVLIRVCLITHSVLLKNLPALEEDSTTGVAQSVYY